MGSQDQSLPGKDADELDAAVMSPQQIIDEIADDQIRFSATLVDDAARQNPGCAVPLDIDRPLASGGPAPKLRPARKAPGFALQQDLEPMDVESPVVRDGVAKARPGRADHLNECLQCGLRVLAQ